MTEYKQCILVRDDLKLPKGKMAVQVAHAALSAYEWADHSVQEEWKRQGQKKVVLKVDKLEDLFRYKEEARRMDIPTALIQSVKVRLAEVDGEDAVYVFGEGPTHA